MSVFMATCVYRGCSGEYACVIVADTKERAEEIAIKRFGDPYQDPGSIRGLEIEVEQIDTTEEGIKWFGGYIE